MKQQGFSLIELVVAVSIISILAAFALPAYQEQVRKARRSDAKIALERIAALQEQYYFRKNIYAADLASLAMSLDSPEGFYSLSVNITSADTGCNADGDCFIATATAKGAQVKDSSCATLSLSNSGEKTSTGGGECW